MLFMKRVLSAVCAFTMAASLSGCSIGRDYDGRLSFRLHRPQDSSKKTPSLGQELVDLKAALDAGAIFPDEYEQKRGEILNDD